MFSAHKTSLLSSSVCNLPVLHRQVEVRTITSKVKRSSKLPLVGCIDTLSLPLCPHQTSDISEYYAHVLQDTNEERESTTEDKLPQTKAGHLSFYLDCNVLSVAGQDSQPSG